MSEHIYYKIVFELLSPMSIGSGSNANTDSDILRDSCGKPYIPATTIAGIMRSFADDKDEIFGFINGNNSKSSPIKIYDASISRESFVTIRNGVKLEKKVAVPGAKFDFEAVETGAEFIGYIELDKNASQYSNFIVTTLAAMNSGVLRFGAKTTRGYGQVKISSVQEKAFNLDTDLDSWLDFDMFDLSSWGNAKSLELNYDYKDKTIIYLELHQVGALSIRSYSTEALKDSKNTPDYKYTSLIGGEPVIPGSSWCGAFRSRFSEFAKDNTTVTDLFGTVDEKEKSSKKSKVTFSESIISDYTIKQITRNSIDRFSAATKDKSLYTELTCYNGKTGLSIVIDKDIHPKSLDILSAVIADLDGGFLAVGGLTAIGRGIFAVDKLTVNNCDKTAELKALKLKNLLTGGNNQ